MKIVTDFSAVSRKTLVGARFSPGSVFRDGVSGVWINPGSDGSIFSNTGGVLPPAVPGELIARAQ